MEKEASMRTLYDYFMERPVKKVLTKEDLPDTEYHQKLKELNMHPIEQWLQDLAETTEQDEKMYNAAQAWDSFRMFCSDNNIKYENLTRRGFETSLAIKKIPGVSKVRQGSRLTVLDMRRLREHYKIEMSVEEHIILDDPE